MAAIPGTFCFCTWYALKKQWFANNVVRLVFCIQGIDMLSLGSFKTGAILLAGLFVYDIFCVFFTPVMATQFAHSVYCSWCNWYIVARFYPVEVTAIGW